MDKLVVFCRDQLAQGKRPSPQFHALKATLMGEMKFDYTDMDQELLFVHTDMSLVIIVANGAVDSVEVLLGDSGIKIQDRFLVELVQCESPHTKQYLTQLLQMWKNSSLDGTTRKQYMADLVALKTRLETECVNLRTLFDCSSPQAIEKTLNSTEIIQTPDVALLGVESPLLSVVLDIPPRTVARMVATPDEHINDWGAECAKKVLYGGISMRANSTHHLPSLFNFVPTTPQTVQTVLSLERPLLLPQCVARSIQQVLGGGWTGQAGVTATLSLLEAISLSRPQGFSASEPTPQVTCLAVQQQKQTFLCAGSHQLITQTQRVLTSPSTSQDETSEGNDAFSLVCVAVQHIPFSSVDTLGTLLQVSRVWLTSSILPVLQGCLWFVAQSLADWLRRILSLRVCVARVWIAWFGCIALQVFRMTAVTTAAIAMLVTIASCMQSDTHHDVLCVSYRC
eukprot:m.194042 g.194042  ORF g.194042 m.194042 type:complete len:453 (+) comp14887_c0_seq13:146-1504(+)